MEYYNTISTAYLQALRREHNSYKIKLELLSADEFSIGEVTRDISISSQGQININRQQITRRSCSITLININGKYNPNKNKWFWVNRKFKLWLGLVVNNYNSDTDIYWFAQGVYYTTSANGDSHTISIEGIDKGGALDGTLKLNMMDGNTIIKAGSKLSNLFRDTLLMSDGLNVIDPVPPLIDTYFDSIITQQDIELSDNQYIGELFSQIADSYGANIYYDANGILRVERSTTESGFPLYMYKGVVYHFADNTTGYGSSIIDYKFEYQNVITVYTNISAKDSNGSSIDNVSYTAYNRSPLSPINIKEIGIRRMDSVEVGYVNGLTQEEMTDRCRQTADFYLKNESLIKMSENFSSCIVPHLDVDNVILITDSFKDLNGEKFVIQSLSYPLSAGEMSVEATNLSYLPSDVDIEKEAN